MLLNALIRDARSLRDPLAVEHAPIDRVDAAIAKLGVVVAESITTTPLGTFANSPRGRLATAFVGIARMTISAALAAPTATGGRRAGRQRSQALGSSRVCNRDAWPSLAVALVCLHASSADDSDSHVDLF
jgi:hypothetical protein